MKEITTDEVAQLLDDPDVTIVDVREAIEVSLGKIPGAKHIPLGELEDRYSELDKNNQQIIICRSGGRSGVATQLLSKQGFDAYNMVGGMIKWDGDVI